tara:strand:+ start:212 stop:412 length:201 start_codon:yes stop_codon:yes gene_type:complete
MAKTYDEDGTETNSISQRQENKKKKVAQMPDYIFESIQRQYGNKKYGDYTIEDKKNVINWYKRKKV